MFFYLIVNYDIKFFKRNLNKINFFLINFLKIFNKNLPFVSESKKKENF